MQALKIRNCHGPGPQTGKAAYPESEINISVSLQKRRKPEQADSGPSPMKETGMLTLVVTPIGNLSDITPRSIEALRTATMIACEDTRVTGKLLSKLEIETHGKLIAYHDRNETQLAGDIADHIESGEDVVLVADAGTPAISDPGFRLVRECRKRGLQVTTTPGASAVVAALSISGLPSDQFLFAGFLAPKSAARKRFFESNKTRDYTIILYESCHRIEKFLNDLVATLGPKRCICVCRELTKLHETIYTGPASEVREKVTNGSRKGEFVVCIAKEDFEL